MMVKRRWKRTIYHHTCSQCGKPYTSQQKQSKYCSRKCHGAYMVGRGRGKTFYSFVCLECRTPFKSQDKNRKFCSPSCASSYNNRHRAKHIYKKCSNCDVTFKLDSYRKLRLRKGHKLFFCSRKCSDKWKIGRERPKFAKTISKIMFRKWKDQDYRVQMLSSISRRPNKVEKFVIRLLRGTKFKYNNGEYIVGGKVPDFYDCESKRVIEVFGRYWHDPELNPTVSIKSTELGTINHYKSRGYDILILWTRRGENPEEMEGSLRRWL